MMTTVPGRQRERRSELRQSVNKVQVISYGFPEHPFELVDFSEQGMRLLTAAPVHPGEFQTFELRLQDEEENQARLQINLFIIWCGVIEESFNCGAKIIADPWQMRRIYSSLQNSV